MRGCRAKRALGAFVASCVCLSPVVATAQERPGFRPGQEEHLLNRPLAPRSSPEIAVPQGTGQVIPNEAESVKFTLSGVTIQGSSVFSQTELAALYDGMLGKEVSLADIYRLAATITVKYREAGYVLSRAIVPAQKISGGTVLITIVEGYIDGIRVEGGNWLADWVKGRVTAYLEQIQDERPVRVQTIERYLLLANEAAGLKIKTVIQPSQQNHGGSDLVAIVEYSPVSAGFNVDNSGSKYTGSWMKTYTAALNSATGWGDKLSLVEVDGAPLRSMRLRQMTYSMPLGNDGLVSSIGIDHTTSRPGFTMENLGIATMTLSRRASLSYPLIRSRSQSLVAEGGVRHKIVNTDVADSRHTSDKLSFAYLRLNYDVSDSWDGANVIQFQAQRGSLPWYTAANLDQNSSRTEVKRHWDKFTLDMVRQQAIGDSGFGVTLGLSGQWSRSKQPAAEEFSLGGRSFGRGYDSGELTGDHGFAGKLEFTYTAVPDEWWLSNFQLYTFADAGQIWNIDNADHRTARAKRSLVSTGLGARNKLNEWVGLDVEISKPLTLTPATAYQKTDDDKKAPRFFLGLRVNY